MYIKYLPGLITIIFLLTFFQVDGQSAKPFVKLSGIVLESDSSKPLSSAHIKITDDRAVLSDQQGYFSVMLHRDDTLTISFIGYQSRKVFVAKDLKATQFFAYVKLHKDTVKLDEVQVYPWPTKEHFKRDFLNLKTTDRLRTVAKNNVDLIMFEAENGASLPMDEQENVRYALEHNPMVGSTMAGGVSIIGLIIYFVKLSRGDFKPKTYQDYLDQKYK